MLAGSAHAAGDRKPTLDAAVHYKHSKLMCEVAAVNTQGERGVNAAMFAAVRH